MDLFNIDIKTPHPRSGKLLVAEPFLRESYFNHAVIAMIDCLPGESAMGVVLNRTTPHTLNEFFDNIEPDVPVYCGGPVSTDRLYFLHTIGDIIPESSEIAPGMYVGGDFTSAVKYVNEGYPLDGCIRFFIGYSGWDAGQLEGEMKSHTWAVADPLQPATKMLAGDDDAMWHDVVRTMGPHYRPWLYHPSNPRDN